MVATSDGLYHAALQVLIMPCSLISGLSLVHVGVYDMPQVIYTVHVVHTRHLYGCVRTAYGHTLTIGMW